MKIGARSKAGGDDRSSGIRAPIMLRAKITPEEWTLIRQRALAASMTNAEYVARLLRVALLTLSASDVEHEHSVRVEP